MAFQGFTPETGAFLWELSFHNERPWFLAHKEQFEAVLNRPFRALCGETLALMNERYPDRVFDAHVSRIYRDARRLFGRGPYKDNLWFTIFEAAQRNEGPALWFEIGRTGWSAGAGFWDASPASMEAYRRQIDANPARFERMVDELGPDFKLWGTPYKRPKGERGDKLDPWYNRRGISVGLEKDHSAEIYAAELPETLAALYARLLPTFDFFCEAWRAGQG